MKPLLSNKQLTLVIKNDPTKEEAFEWLKNLMTEWQLMYHPDEPANRFTDKNTGKRVFTDEECILLENSRATLFETFGKEVYEIGMAVQDSLKGKVTFVGYSSMLLAVFEAHKKDELFSKSTTDKKKKLN